MNKKLFLIAVLFLCSKAYSLEGELRSGANFEFKFKSNEEKFEYKETSYNINLLDLKLKDKDYGFDFGGVFKTSRVNLLINDWSNEQYNKLNENKSLNHDIQGKLFVNWKYPRVSKIYGSLGGDYYLRNYLKRQVTNNGQITEEDTFEYEYVDGDKKYLGGDVELRATLGYKPIDNLDINTNLKYYANRLVDYTKGYPKLSLNNKLEYKVNEESDFKFNHDFALNLRSFVVPYVEEKENEDDEQYAFLDNYVRRYIQNFNLSYKYNKNYSVSAKIEDKGYYIGTTKKEDATQIENHRVKFDLEAKAKNIFDGYEINNNLLIENKFESAKYNYNNNYELWALIKPIHNIDVTKKFDVGYNISLSPQAKFKTEMLFPLTKGIFKSEYFVNKYTPEINLNAKYSKDNLNVNLDLLNKVEFSNLGAKLDKVNPEFKQKLTLEYKPNDKITYELKLGNALEIGVTSDEYNRKYLSSIKDSYSINSNFKYMLLNKENEKLEFSKNLGLKHEIELGYILNGGNVPYIPPTTSPEPDPVNPAEPNINFGNAAESSGEASKFIKSELKDLDPRNRQFSNEVNLLLFVQEYNLDLKLAHSKTIDKLTLENSLELKSKLDVIDLVKEKQAKERNSKEDDVEKRVALETSDKYNRRYNFGGKVEFIPSTKLKYQFSDDLSLSTKLEIPVEFSKLVLNKITDEDRTDVGTYGPADKEFKLRKIAPKISVELNYKW